METKKEVGFLQADILWESSLQKKMRWLKSREESNGWVADQSRQTNQALKIVRCAHSDASPVAQRRIFRSLCV